MEPTPTDPPPRTLLTGKTVSRRVRLADRLAGVVIRTGGAGIVVVVALIFVFLLLETLPLFRAATHEPIWSGRLAGMPAPADVLALGIDEYETHLYIVDAAAGAVRFVDLRSFSPAGEAPLAALHGARATAAYRTPARDQLAIGTSDGRILLGEVRFAVDYAADGTRSVRPSYRALAEIPAGAGGAAIDRVHLRVDAGSGAWHLAAATAGGALVTARFADGEPPEDALPVGGGPGGPLTGLAIDHEGSRLFAATAGGRLLQWHLEEDPGTPFREYTLDSPAAAMDFLVGDGALALGFEDGRAEIWFGVRERETDVAKPVRPIRRFEALPGAAACLQPSARDKGFAVAASDGTVALNFSTSGRTVLRFREDSPATRLAYAPKLTAIAALHADGRVSLRSVRNPHPEISWRTLFGAVHYEGYDQPEHIWQSTGGTDDFEVKFGLVPLVVGTIKGAFYGLLFAVPVAVLAALYTSQLMAPRLQGLVKPTIEIMAALPSVVIGFLAGLWLAPRLEEIMAGTLLSCILVPLLLMVAVLVWNRLPRRVRSRVPEGGELALAIPLVVLGFWLALGLGPWVEAAFLAGDYRQWVFEVFGQQFEQRNSIVIGIAMGFAVIPIVFTISEDAFSNVPQAFRSASFALGASRWQTAWRIVLPTASPGVFSATMIGFGRAVGETMIVLMATGNTPILGFSPFNGMRTLSANIAVEIPEAPAGGTLYRVLFVAALLLFALTFGVNTVAELVRQRLRERYQAV